MASNDIRYLKGIGEKRAALFKKLGIESVYALLHYYPRDYRDYSDITTVYNALPDTVCAVKCRIMSDVKTNFIRKNMTLYRFTVGDDTGLLKVTIFNNSYLAEKLKIGDEYVFYGKIIGTGSLREMSSPEIVPCDTAGITPIYGTTAGLTQGNIRKAVKSALQNIPPEVIPENLLKKYRLCPIGYALNNIHFPESRQALKAARYRLVFEELLLFRMGIMLLRTENRGNVGIKIGKSHIEEYKKLLPFTLTDSQLKAIEQCTLDMLSNKQMNRLVQGDVGSGKTAVAAALMHTCACCGVQSALMAPTEILAEQHFATVSRLLDGSGINVALLTGAVRKKEKDEIKFRLASGEINIIIGTSALLQGDVEFRNLGLVITDEQHRFGVAQRATLAAKGEHPHLLVMSATPIPRTLALIIYGDLDISTITSMPKGRQPIDTYSVDTSYRERIYKFIKKAVAEGRQAYIVCPLVEEDEETPPGLVSATEYYETLSKGLFGDLRLGLLHGKMKPREKEAVMRKFSAGETDVLISTTVVEVGVDVPNATVMVIENAERFGLSQLHQLRGRVGRGQFKSYCILISDMQKGDTGKRLKILETTSDGFKIADEDLRFRGPGDFIGQRQHGLPSFCIADLECDIETLHKAGEAVGDIMSIDPDLSLPEHSGLREAVENMFSNTRDVELN